MRGLNKFYNPKSAVCECRRDAGTFLLRRSLAGAESDHLFGCPGLQVCYLVLPDLAFAVCARLYKAPPKRELTEEERLYVASGGPLGREELLEDEGFRSVEAAVPRFRGEADLEGPFDVRTAVCTDACVDCGGVLTTPAPGGIAGTGIAVFAQVPVRS